MVQKKRAKPVGNIPINFVICLEKTQKLSTFASLPCVAEIAAEIAVKITRSKAPAHRSPPVPAYNL